MDKRVKVVLLIVAVVATAGLIYWLTKGASANDGGTTTYDPALLNPEGGLPPVIPTEDSTQTAPVLPPPQTSELIPPIASTKGLLHYRVVTFTANGAVVTYLDKSKMAVSLSVAELLQINTALKSQKIIGRKI